jgi:hypothetical protein
MKHIVKKRGFIALLSIVIFLLALAGFVISGFLFKAWPTTYNDHVINVTPNMIKNLNNLKDVSKFQCNPDKFYFFEPDEAARLDYEKNINKVIDSVSAELSVTPKKSAILKLFKSSLVKLDNWDSEDKDMALHYYEDMMLILEIDDSNELLNVWRYGVPIGWFVDQGVSQDNGHSLNQNIEWQCAKKN